MRRQGSVGTSSTPLLPQYLSPPCSQFYSNHCSEYVDIAGLIPPTEMESVFTECLQDEL